MNAHVGPDVAIPSKPRELQAAASRPLVRIVVAGHVDHGKSTLIGRLLSESGSLPDGKLDELKAVAELLEAPVTTSLASTDSVTPL